MPSAVYAKANQIDPDKELWEKKIGNSDGRLPSTEIMEALLNKVRRLCSVKTVKQKFPILNWLPKYSTTDLLGDSVAGFTVGLTVIPQGIAYALVAGLPPNYGLYSAFVGSFLYVLFGSCKDITIGPTAIMAILTHEYAKGDPNVAVLLAFTSGLIILAFGIFNLGFLISFISKAVISGFTSAAAITIFTSQLKGLFGVKFPSDGPIDTWIKMVTHVRDTRWQDLTLGLVCIGVLLFLRRLKDFPAFKRRDDDGRLQRALKKTIFLFSVARNAILVIGATVISACLDANQPFSITGEIKPGLPDVGPPPFSTNNGTTSFIEIVSHVGSGVVILPLISVLESIAIASSFAKGRTIDATQEMIALGMCNLGGSFFQSMTTTGSFSRTAVNSTSGVRTPAGGIVTGVLIVLALAVLTPYFKYIPISAMSAVIICALIFMIEFHEVVPIWRVRKLDQLVLWVTFLGCLGWKLEFGIVLGILVNLGIFLIFEANPKVEVNLYSEELDGCPPHVIVKPHSGLQFVSAERIRIRVSKAGLDAGGGVAPVVLDCSHFSIVDYSGSKGMQGMCADFKNRGQPLIFMSVRPDIERALRALTHELFVVERESLVDVLSAMCICTRCKTVNCSNCSNEQRNEHRNLISSDLRIIST